MANAKIDNNREKTAIAVDTDGNIANLKVDATTGRLLIEINTATNTVPVQRTVTKPDENYHRVSMVYDGTTTKPLLINSDDGYLWCDVLIE